MLPKISTPKIGTPGERFRDRQLAIQLPKQDLARVYCNFVEPKNYTNADDFISARNEIALDVGTVRKVVENNFVSKIKLLF